MGESFKKHQIHGRQRREFKKDKYYVILELKEIKSYYFNVLMSYSEIQRHLVEICLSNIYYRIINK